jgi:hypothetical protein
MRIIALGKSITFAEIDNFKIPGRDFPESRLEESIC